MGWPEIFKHPFILSMQGDISNNISQPKIKLKKGTSIEVIKFNDIEEERSSVDFTESTAT